MNTTRIRLSEKSMKELLAIQQAICNDPAQRNPNPDSIFIYKPSARRRLNDIGWAITQHLQAKRA